MRRIYFLECVVWEFTLKCNLNCLHCGSSAGRARKRELDTKEALALCRDLIDAGCLSVALMGGEPLLRYDFWEVAGEIRKLGMDLSVITSGTISPPGVFRKLRDLSPRAVAVSIDGATRNTHEKIRGVPGCYEKSWEFINNALREKLPVSVITTVSKLNICELKPLSEQIMGRGIAWQIQTAGAEGSRFPKDLLLDREEFYSVGMFIEHLRTTYPVSKMPVIGAHDLGYNSHLLRNISIYEKWPGCQAGISILGVRSDGNVIGCLSLNDDRFVEGNIRERRLSEIWDGEDAFSYNRKFKTSDAGENCSACPHLKTCRGGCCEMSLMKTGSFHNDFYCFRSIENEFMITGKTLPKSSGSKTSKRFAKIRKIFLGERE